MSLPRYPTYRRTGFDRIPDVPAHWNVLPLGRLGTLLKGSGGSKEDIVDSGLPCVRYGDLYTTHSYTIQQSRTHISEAVAARYTRLQYGDVLFAASGETFEEIGKSAVNLIDGEAYCGGDVVILRSSLALAPRFMGYAADSLPARQQKASLGRGTTIKHIYPDELRKVVVAVPPEAEQTAIADFLDYQMNAVDELVIEQRCLIELLNEKRQALISHAVTKGLNPDAPMKASGVEWLGAVPDHWRIRELRHLVKKGTTITYGIVQAGPDIENGIPYIRTSDMRGQSLAESGYLRTSAEIDASYKRSKVMHNDLVIAIRASVGKGLLVPEWLEGANLTQGTARISPGPELLPRFLLWAFNSDYCQTTIRRAAKGSTFLEITLDALRRVAIAVPSLREQELIVDMVDRAVRQLDLLIEEVSSAIAMLQERRTALISAGVTGQIDVRGLAAVATPDLKVGPTVGPTTVGRSAAEVA